MRVRTLSSLAMIALLPLAACAQGSGGGAAAAAPAPSVSVPVSAPSSPAVTTPTTTPKPSPPCSGQAAACVSLSAELAWLLRDGQVVFGPVPIKPGKAESPTPQGTFRVQWKDREHYSSEFAHLPMPNSVFFAAGGIAFHGGSLDAGSHGCVHLDDAASAQFFDFLGVGAVVEVVA